MHPVVPNSSRSSLRFFIVSLLSIGILIAAVVLMSFSSGASAKVGNGVSLKPTTSETGSVKKLSSREEASFARGSNAFIAPLSPPSPVRTLYSLNPDINTLYAFPITLSDGSGSLSATGTATTVVGSNTVSMALSPDGIYLYALNLGSDTVSVLTVNTDGSLTLSSTSPQIIPGASMAGIAVAPDGKHVYAVGNNGQHGCPCESPNTGTTQTEIAALKVSAVDGSLAPDGAPLAAGSVRPYANPDQFVSIAVAPNASHLFLSTVANDEISQVTLNPDGSLGAASIVTSPGDGPFALAVSPNNNALFVVDAGPPGVDGTQISAYQLTNGALDASPVPVKVSSGGFNPYAIAVAPDGAHLWVTNNGRAASPGVPEVPQNVAAFALNPDGTLGAGPPTTMLDTDGVAPQSIVVSPDGKHVYVGNVLNSSGSFPGNVVVYSVDTNGALTRTSVGATNTQPFSLSLAINPNQGPTASFADPTSPTATQSITFDGSGSSDSDGTVARYNWEFGDGTVLPNGGATPSHTYTQSGTFNVTLTVTDNEGCSSAFVFTGQTASCNGGTRAIMTRSISVAKADQLINVTTHAPAPSAPVFSQFIVAVTATSGLPITYGSSGGCTNSGATYTMNSPILSCTVTYDQGGDSTYNQATQVVEVVTAVKADTTTAVSSSANPSTFGQSVTFTATVTPSTSGPLTGTVQFKDNGANLGSPQTLSGGTASISTSSLSAGTHPITADYSGDSNFNGSTGTLSSNQVVNCGGTEVTNTGDSAAGSLRDIIAHACPGNTITFNIPISDPGYNATIDAYTITLTSGELLIDKDLTITGPGAKRLKVVRDSAASQFRIFNVNSGAVTISGLAVSGGSDIFGGGVFINSGNTTTLKGVAIANNSASSGGGIKVSGGTVNLINSLIANNTATGESGGGGIHNFGNLNIINSTISGNNSQFDGGGINHSGQSLKLFDDTITNNRADSDNSGSGQGGGIKSFEGSNTIRLDNTIVAGNFRGIGSTADDISESSSTIDTANSFNNLIGAINSSSLTNGTNGNQVGVANPMLGTLADNGGLTQTHLLISGSSAIDAGSNAQLPADTFDLDGDIDTAEPLPVDQRGFTRIVHSTVDIGAVEVSYSITATAGTPQSANVNSAFGTDLQAIVSESGIVRSGISVTFTAPGSGPSGTFPGSVAAATVTTDASGVATAPVFTANGIAGSYFVVASLAASQPTAVFSLKNTKIDQNITVSTHAPSVAAYNSSFTVAATASSGLAVTYSSSGSCTNIGATFTMTSSTGTCSVMYDQTGDATYNPAPRVTENVTAQKANQTITVTTHALANATYNSSFTVAATASSGLAVTYSSSGSCSNSGATFTMTSGTGTCSVMYDQGGDGNYNAAAQVTESVTAQKAGTTTVVSSSVNPSAFGQSVTFTATINSGTAGTLTGSVQFKDNGVNLGSAQNLAGGVASISISTLSAGTHTMTAVYSGDSNFSGSTGTLSPDQVVNCGGNVVTNTSNSAPGSLRDIVAHACAGSTITFNIPQSDPGFNSTTGIYTITLISGELSIDKGLIINGLGANKLTVSGNNGSRVINVTVANPGVVTFSGLTIANGNNGSGVFGGGLRNGSSGGINLISSAVSNNTASTGGGIYNQGAGTINIVNSTVNGNSAPNGEGSGSGGAIFNQAAGTINIINSTLSGNTAGNTGGGLSNTGSGNVNITNSTVTGNNASGSNGGGGIRNESTGQVQLGNTVVAGNTAGVGPDLSGTFVSQGHNLIGQNDGSSGFTAGVGNSNGDLVGTSASPILANLGPLQNYGGPTLTHLPLPGSLAINSGSSALLPADTFDLDGDSDAAEPLPVDQRGFTRVVNSQVDIGAVEVNYSITATAGTPQSANVGSAFSTNLQATVTESGIVRSGISVTFTAPGSGPSGTFPGSVASATVTTDASGVATAPVFTANGIAGGPYSVVASLAPGLSTSSFSLTNTKRDQTISVITHAPSVAAYNNSFTVAATASSGLPVTYSSSGSCTNIGATFTMTSSTGTCSVVYDQAGDATYNPAPRVTENVTAKKADQTITVTTHAPANATYNSSFTVAATASSGLPVTYSSSGSCTNSGVTFTITSGAGTCSVIYSQGGDGNYNPAAQATESVTAQKASQTITFGALAGKTYGDPPFQVNATSTSGLAVSFQIISGPATISGNTVTITGAGTVAVRASQAGDNNYNAATPVDQSFIIAKANQTITFGALTNKTYGDPPYNVSGTSSSGLSVTFSIVSGPATISGNTVTIIGAGTVMVRASQTGDNNYNAATPVDQSFTVVQAASTTTVTSSQNPSEFGQSVTFTATVSSSAGTPTGTVQFKDGGSNLGSPVTISGGKASASFSNLSSGNHNITAVYSGDANFLSSTGTLANGQTVNVSVGVSIGDASVTEGDAGSKGMTFTVTLSAATTQTASVDYQTADGTAKVSDNDYQAASGTVTFNPGETSKTISVQVNGDLKFEADETFVVNLSNAVNTSISRAQATGTIKNDDPQGGIISFTSPDFIVKESDGQVLLNVVRTGDTTFAAKVDYASADLTAKDHGDYNTALGTISFAAGESSKTVTVLINEDSYVDPAEIFTVTLSNPTGGAVLGSPGTATVMIVDNDTQQPPLVNIIDDQNDFVRQQYHDFLYREPDAGGWAYWTNEITKCGSDQTCIRNRRIDVAAAFFIEQEFQETGFFAYRLFVATFGRAPSYLEFVRAVSNVKAGASPRENQSAMLNALIESEPVKQLYSTMSNSQYLDTTYANARLQFSDEQRSAIIGALDAGVRTRADVLEQVVGTQAFIEAEFNAAFVLMQYFEYLRRDPDPLGYQFWLDVLNNKAPRNYRSMVCSFITSKEYQERFSSVVTRTNQECQ